jgi:hypothetical protein
LEEKVEVKGATKIGKEIPLGLSFPFLLPARPPMFAPPCGGLRPSLSAMSLKARPSLPRLEPVKVDLGEVRGRACERHLRSVFLEFPVEQRLRAEAAVSCEHDIMKVVDMRGAGPMTEVVLALEGSAVVDYSVRGSGGGAG